METPPATSNQRVTCFCVVNQIFNAGPGPDDTASVRAGGTDACIGPGNDASQSSGRCSGDHKRMATTAQPGLNQKLPLQILNSEVGQ